MARVLGFLIRYFSNYYTLHRSDLAARAAPLDPRLDFSIAYNCGRDQQYYTKIGKTSTLLGLEPRIF